MTVRIEAGDCRDVMPRLAAEGVRAHACVTDPPYGLVSIVKRFGAPNAAPVKDGHFSRVSRGFMGQTWDGTAIERDPSTWRLVFDLLPPGGHLAAFTGTRTYHRIASAIEDAGFEIRDQLAWVYGTGFPKSHGLRGEWDGWGTALKPGWEPIVLARRPLAGTVQACMERNHAGALHIDACRVAAAPNDYNHSGRAKPAGAPNSIFGARPNKRQQMPPSTLGRWPANLLHDGSAEVLDGFPQTRGVSNTQERTDASRWFRGAVNFDGGSSSVRRKPSIGRNDFGSAARFFYSAKAGPDDRLASKHPTVKPVALMRWLLRLIVPPGGLVLDPFAGTGTTGAAAIREGMRAILIEREPKYLADIAARIHAIRGEDAPLFVESDARQMP